LDELLVLGEELDRILSKLRHAAVQKGTRGSGSVVETFRSLLEKANSLFQDDGRRLEEELTVVFLRNFPRQQAWQLIHGADGIRQTVRYLVHGKMEATVVLESPRRILFAAARLRKELEQIKRLLRTDGRNPLEMDILGYGEISTVMKPRGRFSRLPASTLCSSPWVYKRMPIFPNMESARHYIRVYEEYRRILNEKIGLRVPVQAVQFVEREDGRVSLYALQHRLPARSVCHKLIHHVDDDTGEALFRRILEEYRKVWAFNDKNSGIQVGLDGQISNWALPEDPGQLPPRTVGKCSIFYLDTGTPLFRIDGQEQLETEIFLKNSPSFLRWIIRQFFLQDVLDRYYDLRSVVLDAIANLYKEGKAEWIPRWIDLANSWFEACWDASVEPLTEREVRRYYREDAFIWRFFQASRRIDRFITEKIRRQRYEFRLPGKIKR